MFLWQYCWHCKLYVQRKTIDRRSGGFKPLSHVTFASAFASNFKNGFCGQKWWCSHLTSEHDGKDQRKNANTDVMCERTFSGDTNTPSLSRPNFNHFLCSFGRKFVNSVIVNVISTRFDLFITKVLSLWNVKALLKCHIVFNKHALRLEILDANLFEFSLFSRFCRFYRITRKQKKIHYLIQGFDLKHLWLSSSPLYTCASSPGVVSHRHLNPYSQALLTLTKSSKPKNQ